jgi:hypothetical protein
VAVPGWEESVRSFPSCQHLARMRVGIGSAAETVNLRVGRRNLMTPSKKICGSVTDVGSDPALFFPPKTANRTFFGSSGTDAGSGRVALSLYLVFVESIN